MTPLPPDDPLVALWQTAPKPDTHHLLQDLQSLNRLHQRLNRSVLGIVCGIAILLIFEEATGRIASHGVLSAIWIIGLAIGVLWHRRARCNRSLARNASSARFRSVISVTTYENLVRPESPGPILATTADSHTAPLFRECQYSNCTGLPFRSARRYCSIQRLTTSFGAPIPTALCPTVLRCGRPKNRSVAGLS